MNCRFTVKVCNSNKSYGGRIRKGYFCAGLAEGGKDGCRYDSGGPLMCSRDKSAPWYLVGIMTWGEGCAGKDKYGVYTNVTTHMDTIRARVKGGLFFSTICMQVSFKDKCSSRSSV